MKLKMVDLETGEVSIPDFVEIDKSGNLFREEKALLLFIGLKDANGREIYYRDIVKVDGFLYRVEYNPDIAAFFLKALDITPDLHFGIHADRLKSIEATGNYYETPNLASGLGIFMKRLI